jgi:hypothetical protein
MKSFFSGMLEWIIERAYRTVTIIILVSGGIGIAIGIIIEKIVEKKIPSI